MESGASTTSLCSSSPTFSRETPLLTTYRQGATIICSSPTILRLGAVQALMEVLASILWYLSTTQASMFIFVYLWTPTLSSGGLTLPLGKIFAAFMV